MTILNANCTSLDLDLITSVDVMITDPPFSADVQGSMMSSHTLASGGPASRDVGFDPLSPELLQFLACCTSLVKRWSLIHTDFESVHDWKRLCEHFKAEYLRTIPWIRWSQPQLSGDRPGQGGEAVVWVASEASAAALIHPQEVGPRGGAKPKVKRWNGRGGLVHFEERCMRGADKHPTEKPIDLLLTQVSAFSDPGELVLDPCCGSGTTGVACRLLGRGFVGVERDPAWAKVAAQRETAALSPRDQVRAEEWCTRMSEEVPAEPRSEAERATWERALRRQADVQRVRKALGK